MRRYKEIDPEDIFLDASNLPEFESGRLEGRLERPLSEGSYFGLFSAAFLLFLILTGKAIAVSILGGEAYAAQSERNRLRPEVLFAERGAITDRNEVPLAWNESGNEGFPKRSYLHPGFGHVLGYVSYPEKDTAGNYYQTEIEGVAGIERAFDGLLAGENGTRLIEENAKGDIQSQGSIDPAENGETLALALDARVQQAFFDAIQETADTVPYKGGSGILMDVETGEVIALVSYPEYDSNILSEGTPAEVISGYATNAREPHLDRAVSGLYTPGSIVKPLLAAGAYNDGIISPEKIIVSTGSISLPNPYDPSRPSIFKDWKALGPMNMRSAIAYSSDVYFYSVGGGFGDQKGMGIERLDYWYQAFGFTDITGIEIENENSGFIPTPAWKEETYDDPWRIGDTYHTAIGQYAVQITPLEAVRMVAAIANGGKLVQPTLIRGGSSEGRSIAIDPEALQIAREGMRMGVTEGTSVGLNAYAYVKAAGKTGTAQLGLHNEYYNTWAVGFFPYDHPKYAYAVVMEKGPAGTSIGGIYVMSHVFERMGHTAPEYFGIEE
jgi:penicillin-binding protein 2